MHLERFIEVNPNEFWVYGKLVLLGLDCPRKSESGSLYSVLSRRSLQVGIKSEEAATGRSARTFAYSVVTLYVVLAWYILLLTGQENENDDEWALGRRIQHVGSQKTALRAQKRRKP